MGATHASTLAIPRMDLVGAVEEYDPLSEPFIAREIFTPVEVPSDSGNFGRIPAEAMMTLENVERGAGGNYPRSDYKLAELSYLISHYGHEGRLDDTEVGRFAMILDCEAQEVKRLYGILMRREEKRAADLIFNETTFPLSNNTGLDATTDWDNASSGTPIDDVNTGITKKRGVGSPRPNTLIINDLTWRSLSRSAQILDKMKYTMQETINFKMRLDLLASALGIEKVLVGMARYNSADKGLTLAASEIWSNLYAFLCYTSPDTSPRSPCIGHTFYWQGGTGGRGTKGGKGLLSAMQYREEANESDIYRIGQSVQSKITYPECGFLIKVDT